VAVAGSGLAFAQAAFEVASVKANASARSGAEGSTREVIESPPGSLTMHNVSLRTCVKWAYGLRDYQLQAPAWLGSERYDIAAKAAGAAAVDQLRLMLQALLAERFKLTAHRETKELTVFALAVAKSGPKLRAAKATGRGRELGDAEGSMKPSGGALVFRNYSMAELAERLSARPFNMARPVVDRTGLTGRFDFGMKFSDNDAELKRTMERMEADQSSFASALNDLGLKLDPQKAPVEILIVDRADKVPTEND
jgi:uncharacterized protein (TIGR03435 family)